MSPPGNVEDARAGVAAVGEHAGLGAGARTRGHADGLQRHGGEGDGLLFADGEELIHLAGVGEGLEGVGAGDEFVGHAGAGGDDDDDLVSLLPGFLDACGDVPDAVDVGDRGAAVLLDDEGHFVWKGNGGR